MKRRITPILAILVIYSASYLVCRIAYQTREDEYITLYDEDSLISLFAHFIHTPFVHLDALLTGRRTEIGNWRDAPSPEMIRRSEERLHEYYEQKKKEEEPNQ